MMTADRPKPSARPRSCPVDARAGTSWSFIHCRYALCPAMSRKAFKSSAGAARPPDVRGGPQTRLARPVRNARRCRTRSEYRANKLTSHAPTGALDIAKSEDDASCAIIAHLRCRRPRRDGDDEGKRSAIGDPHAPANSARSLAIWWRRSTRHRGSCFTGPGTAHLLVVRLGGLSLDNRPNDILHVAARLTPVKSVL
jgi:hypothetical protein